jgi:hypothetical protein
VNRIEKKEILHIGVFIQAWTLEGEESGWVGIGTSGNRSRCRRAGSLLEGYHEGLRRELVYKGEYGSLYRILIACITGSESLEDGLLSEAGTQAFPDPGPGACSAVVGTIFEIDEDRLAIDGLMDDTGFIDSIGLRAH